MTERIAALKVIEENKAEKAKRNAEKLAEREHAQKLIADAIKHGEEQDAKRAAEWAAREEKIKQAMGRMADTVLKKSNAAEKEFEVRLLQQANDADKKAE